MTNPIKKFRKQYGFKQKTMAETFGLSKKAIQNYEQGIRPIPKLLIVAISLWKKLH